MPKYATQSEYPVIVDPIIRIVHDAIDFQKSRICGELRPTNPRQWKWVKLQGHRRSGFTTTTLKLLERHPSTLIVCPSDQQMHYTRRYAYEEVLTTLARNPHTNDILEQIVSDHKMTNWFRGNYRRYELIILDQASMIERNRRGQMENFRDELFLHCNLLVELG